MTAWLPAPLTEERGSWSRSQVSRVEKAAWRPRLSSSRLHSVHGYDLPERVCVGLFILILLGFLPSRTCCSARLSPLGFLVPRTPRVSAGGDVASPPNRGTAAVDGDSFGCHTGGGGGYYNPAGGVQDATARVAVGRTTSHTRGHSAEGQPAMVEKSQSSPRSWSVIGSWMTSRNPCGPVAKNEIEAARCQARGFSHTKSSLLPLRFSEKGN